MFWVVATQGATMFEIPKLNYTQIPNTLFDEMLPKLGAGEMRILLVIMRHTFGWGNKEWEWISISQLMEKTGMQRKAVCNNTKSLEKKGIITKVLQGKNGAQKTWYSLVVPKGDFPQNPIDNSNNSYQYPRDTGIFRIPTKQRNTLKKSVSVSPPSGVDRAVPPASGGEPRCSKIKEPKTTQVGPWKIPESIEYKTPSGKKKIIHLQSLKLKWCIKKDQSWRSYLPPAWIELSRTTVSVTNAENYLWKTIKNMRKVETKTLLLRYFTQEQIDEYFLSDKKNED